MRGFCLRWKTVLASVLLLGSTILAARAETRDYAIELSAEIQKSPPQIRLNWRPSADGLGFSVSRKAKDATSWTSIATLPSSATSYTDTNVRVGEGYEYRVLKNPVPDYGGSGFIYAGIDLPLIENRDKLILLVDSTHAPALATELSRLESDLVGDGWTVLRHDVGRDQSPPQVKSLIKADYQADPVNVKAVFIFGHVPVPYSGNIVPDGHEDGNSPNHRGAWPADAYYGDIDGNWTDSSVNNTVADRAENDNTPGDGKFDQSTFPSDIELQVGRVDLANMNSFAPKTELDLLRQYLEKDHNFRHGGLLLGRRALINDNFGDSWGEAFASSGWRNFSTFFGSDNIISIPGYQYFDKLKNEGYLWSYACGGGAYNYCNYVGGTGDYGFNDVKTVFTFLLGSYFGDWDAENSFLRGPLGSATYGLTSGWAGRPHWFVHHMALGETIGYGTRLTQNSGNGSSATYHPRQHERSVHIALMGDPTLRMHPVLPPSNVSAQTEGSAVRISWAPSNDSDLQGYNIYKSGSPRGPFTRVNTSPVSGTTFLDPNGSGSVYRVRAIKLDRSASGTYFNASQGITATLTGGSPNEQVPLTISRAPAGLQISFPTELSKQYILEHSTNFSAWSPLQTITATALTSIITPPTSATLDFYRVRQL